VQVSMAVGTGHYMIPKVTILGLPVEFYMPLMAGVYLCPLQHVQAAVNRGVGCTRTMSPFLDVRLLSVNWA
jgi:hypothetical protein